MNGDLSDYIRFGFLKPGKNVFTFESSGSEHFATLLSDGSLLDEDQRKHNDIYTWYLKYAEPPFNYKVKYKGVMFDLYQRYMKQIRSTVADLRREESFRLKELDSKDRTILSDYIKTENSTDINEVNSNSSTSDRISVESDCGITFSNSSSSKSDLSESQSPIENEAISKSTKRKINEVSIIKSKNSSNNGNKADNSLRQHITLLDGLKCGVFKPGKDVFSVKYNNIKYTGSLTSDGNILYENNKYSNPSRWVMNIYKRVNPNRKSVSGWKVIYYNNQPIINYVAVIEDKLSKMKLTKTILHNSSNSNNNNKRRRINNNNNNNNNSESEDDEEEESESENDEDDSVILDEEVEENNNRNNNNVNNINGNKKQNHHHQQQQQKSSTNSKKYNNNNNNIAIIIDEDPEPLELQTIQLKPFIEKGLIQPGVDILEYKCNGINCRASLMKNGKIRDANYVKYKTPTEWGNAVLEYYGIKSRLNHWNRIRYDSQPILHYYDLLLK